ncbi:MAG: sugar phosphate isomerase/epimerase [Lachnospiraceae bacterium]|nr:sugar phosphate isomerase/epimerase [Lachnospiraceae bacterium]
MRLGISSSLKHCSPEEWAKKQKELGCEAVVFPIDSRADASAIDAYADAAHKCGLMIAEVGIWKNPLSLDADAKKEAMEYSVAQLKLADYLKARCCVNIAGTTGSRWDGAYPQNFSEDLWKQSVRTIQEVIDRADPQNTAFTIEPMPWMIPTGPDEYLQLIKEVNRECFAVHMDFFNMINCPQRYLFHEQFMDECFQKLGAYIKSCHLKDVRLLPELTFQLKECACGEGEIKLEHYIHCINETDPEMPVIIEHLQKDQDYIDSVRYVKEHLL